MDREPTLLGGSTTMNAEKPSEAPVVQTRSTPACRDETYPDLVQLNVKRTVLDAVDRALLERIVLDQLGILDTAATIFETNGDYATATRPHGWCRVMDDLSRPACEDREAMHAIDSGQWSCRTSCRRPALDAVRTGESVELDCPGGMRVRAVPIRAGETIVGAISYGCGGPPKDDARLASLAERLHVSAVELRRKAEAFASTSPAAEAAMAKAVDAAAGLLGAIVGRRIEEQERDRARDTAIGTIAHDLRTPLSTVTLATTALLKKLRSDSAEARLVRMTQRSAQSMNRLIEDLVDLTRARAGKEMPLERQPHDLGVLCADVVTELRHAFPSAVIVYESRGQAMIDVDADRIRRVIMNLIVNAVRHGASSTIDVRVEPSADEVVLRVHNGGPPIPRDALPTIFDPFDRGRMRSSSEGSEGLGLGLFIVREIVSAHGGRVDVDSKEASGTTFTVRLPR